jgi:hypothetical protein
MPTARAEAMNTWAWSWQTPAPLLKATAALSCTSLVPDL